MSSLLRNARIWWLRPGTAAGLVAVAAIALAAGTVVEYNSGIVWPEPKVVDPGPVGGPPADAIVLFDGKDMSQWEGGDEWIVKDGYAITGGKPTSAPSNPSATASSTWNGPTPEQVDGSGQGRGNSGVFLMGRYEIQVLDSYENETYYDGQCGAIYKQHPPLVNACRKPGEWQTYDIIFTAPSSTRTASCSRRPT